ncbi:MAG TPA: nucleoside recognition domain-containing protein, partial [Thermoanaerobaculia bacterium]
LVFLVTILAIVFWFVGLFGAGTLVNLMETGVFKQRITPLAIRATDALLPFPHTHDTKSIAFTFSVPLTPVNNIPLGTMERNVIVPTYALAPGAHLGPGAQVLRFVHDFLVGQYGVVSMALSYAFAIVLPIVTAFFLLFSLLEDSGYLPRMAIMVNRLFRLMGLNGKAVLPMILGLGCDTMATMTTRILETKKERVVTTMLLALAVPCSAQLGVLLAMMASLSPMAAFAWMGMMIGIVLLVGSLTARAFPGEAGDFILEIPPMRRPQFSNIWRKTLGRLDWYLREVIPLFVVGTAALFLLDKIRALPAIARAGEPLVTGWLGLPKEMSNAFLIGFLRRDFGAVYILDAATGPHPLLSHLQIFVAMVTITLFMPCIANFLMIGKEHGMKTAWAMAAFIFPFAFFVGGLVHHLGLWLNIF